MNNVSQNDEPAPRQAAPHRRPRDNIDGAVDVPEPRRRQRRQPLRADQATPEARQPEPRQEELSLKQTRIRALIHDVVQAAVPGDCLCMKWRYPQGGPWVTWRGTVIAIMDERSLQVLWSGPQAEPFAVVFPPEESLRYASIDLTKPDPPQQPSVQPIQPQPQWAEFFDYQTQGKSFTQVCLGLRIPAHIEQADLIFYPNLWIDSADYWVELFKARITEIAGWPHKLKLKADLDLDISLMQIVISTLTKDLPKHKLRPAFALMARILSRIFQYSPMYNLVPEDFIEQFEKLWTTGTHVDFSSMFLTVKKSTTTHDDSDPLKSIRQEVETLRKNSQDHAREKDREIASVLRLASGQMARSQTPTILALPSAPHTVTPNSMVRHRSQSGSGHSQPASVFRQHKKRHRKH